MVKEETSSGSNSVAIAWLALQHHIQWLRERIQTRRLVTSLRSRFLSVGLLQCRQSNSLSYRRYPFPLTPFQFIIYNSPRFRRKMKLKIEAALLNNQESGNWSLRRCFKPQALKFLTSCDVNIPDFETVLCLQEISRFQRYAVVYTLQVYMYYITLNYVLSCYILYHVFFRNLSLLTQFSAT